MRFQTIEINSRVWVRVVDEQKVNECTCKKKKIIPQKKFGPQPGVLSCMRWRGEREEGKDHHVTV